MSHNSNDRLYAAFLSELETVVACPYCGTEKQLEPARLCCGEVHAQTYYLINGDLVDPMELSSHYETWLEARKNAPPISNEDKYWDAYKDYDNKD